MTEQKRTPRLFILAAWLVVSLPAAWGLYNTVLNAAKLLQSSAAQNVKAASAKNQ
jgi:hypothetical protein